MSATLANTPWPDGTTVYAYDATGYPSGFPGANPPGNPVAEAVASGFSVTFEGLTDNVPYMAAGKVGGEWRYRKFIPDAEDPHSLHPEVGPPGPIGPIGPEGTPAVTSVNGEIGDITGLATQDEVQGAEGAAAKALEAEEGVRAAADAVMKEAPLNVEYPEYGADGTGSTVSDAAFAKAIAALPAEGGELFIPRHYKLTEALKVEGRRSIRFRGCGGLTAGNEPASRILFTQGGSSPAIDAKGAVGICFADLTVYYSNEALTGFLVDLSHGKAGTDSSFGVFERCQFAGLSVRSAMAFNLDQAINMTFRDCVFQNFDVAVPGQKEASRYSNDIRFDGCTFAGMKTIPAKNAGEAWAFRNCTFEQLSSGDAGAYISDAGVLAAGLKFDTCWFGDSSTAAGTWVLFRGKGLYLGGGSLGSGALGLSVPDVTSKGVTVGDGLRLYAIKDGVRLETGVSGYLIGGYSNEATGKKVSLDGGATDAGGGFLHD